MSTGRITKGQSTTGQNYLGQLQLVELTHQNYFDQFQNDQQIKIELVIIKN